MNRIEILAPAGDMESLKAAIANGADAIYLGGQRSRLVGVRHGRAGNDGDCAENSR